MADLVFNISKGRVAELYNRVKTTDPSTSRLFVDVFSGSVTDGALKDCVTIAAAVTAGLTALTTNGWTSKTLTASDIPSMAPDQTADTMPLTLSANPTWTAVSAGTSTRLIISYSSVTSPTTTQKIPLTSHDFAVTPDGSDVVAVINTAGFFVAS